MEPKFNEKEFNRLWEALSNSRTYGDSSENLIELEDFLGKQILEFLGSYVITLDYPSYRSIFIPYTDYLIPDNVLNKIGECEAQADIDDYFYFLFEDDGMTACFSSMRRMIETIEKYNLKVKKRDLGNLKDELYVLGDRVDKLMRNQKNT